ncbi:MAG: rod shape-determining protein [Candidatus Nanopelagicales bacterium]|jgi:rod shape-determining protein MreB|nr:rod shape-determining protein [Candidatus Nanopelagicales bacterium]
MALLADSRPRPRLGLGRELAVDLGTSRTRIYSRGSGVVLDEPSVVAIRDGEVVAVGEQAKQMLGRAPEQIEVIEPLEHGVIRHYDATERMLRYFVQQAHGRSLISRPRLVVNVPSHLTGVEQRAVRDAAYAAGARQVYLLPTALAAAIGADVPIHETQGHFVMSMGAGCTEIAVVALGGIVSGSSLRHGGRDLDLAVVDYLAEHFDMRIGEVSAEQVKMQLGSAVPIDAMPVLAVQGQDTRTGLPKQIELSATHVRKALQSPIEQMLSGLRRVLDATPAEVAGDLVNNGLVVTGGAALLQGLPERLEHDLGLPVRRAAEPDLSVVDGAGRCAENINRVRRLLLIEPAF